MKQSSNASNVRTKPTSTAAAAAKRKSHKQTNSSKHDGGGEGDTKNSRSHNVDDVQPTTHAFASSSSASSSSSPFLSPIFSYFDQCISCLKIVLRSKVLPLTLFLLLSLGFVSLVLFVAVTSGSSIASMDASASASLFHQSPPQHRHQHDESGKEEEVVPGKETSQLSASSAALSFLDLQRKQNKQRQIAFGQNILPFHNQRDRENDGGISRNNGPSSFSSSSSTHFRGGRDSGGDHHAGSDGVSPLLEHPFDPSTSLTEFYEAEQRIQQLDMLQTEGGGGGESSGENDHPNENAAAEKTVMRSPIQQHVSASSSSSSTHRLPYHHRYSTAFHPDDVHNALSWVEGVVAGLTPYPILAGIVQVGGKYSRSDGGGGGGRTASRTKGSDVDNNPRVNNDENAEDTDHDDDYESSPWLFPRALVSLHSFPARYHNPDSDTLFSRINDHYYHIQRQQQQTPSQRMASSASSPSPSKSFPFLVSSEKSAANRRLWHGKYEETEGGGFSDYSEERPSDLMESFYFTDFETSFKTGPFGTESHTTASNNARRNSNHAPSSGRPPTSGNIVRQRRLMAAVSQYRVAAHMFPSFPTREKERIGKGGEERRNTTTTAKRADSTTTPSSIINNRNEFGKLIDENDILLNDVFVSSLVRPFRAGLPEYRRKLKEFLEAFGKEAMMTEKEKNKENAMAMKALRIKIFSSKSFRDAFSQFEIKNANVTQFTPLQKPGLRTGADTVTLEPRREETINQFDNLTLEFARVMSSIDVVSSAELLMKLNNNSGKVSSISSSSSSFSSSGNDDEDKDDPKAQILRQTPQMWQILNPEIVAKRVAHAVLHVMTPALFNDECNNALSAFYCTLCMIREFGRDPLDRTPLYDRESYSVSVCFSACRCVQWVRGMWGGNSGIKQARLLTNSMSLKAFEEDGKRKGKKEKEKNAVGEEKDDDDGPPQLKGLMKRKGEEKQEGVEQKDRHSTHNHNFKKRNKKGLRHLIHSLQLPREIAGGGGFPTQANMRLSHELLEAVYYYAIAAPSPSAPLSSTSSSSSSSSSPAGGGGRGEGGSASSSLAAEAAAIIPSFNYSDAIATALNAASASPRASASSLLPSTSSASRPPATLASSSAPLLLQLYTHRSRSVARSTTTTTTTSSTAYIDPISYHNMQARMQRSLLDLRGNNKNNNNKVKTNEREYESLLLQQPHHHPSHRHKLSHPGIQALVRDYVGRDLSDPMFQHIAKREERNIDKKEENAKKKDSSNTPPPPQQQPPPLSILAADYFISKTTTTKVGEKEEDANSVGDKDLNDVENGRKGTTISSSASSSVSSSPPPLVDLNNEGKLHEAYYCTIYDRHLEQFLFLHQQRQQDPQQQQPFLSDHHYPVAFELNTTRQRPRSDEFTILTNVPRGGGGGSSGSGVSPSSPSSSSSERGGPSSFDGDGGKGGGGEDDNDGDGGGGGSSDGDQQHQQQKRQEEEGDKKGNGNVQEGEGGGGSAEEKEGGGGIAVASLRRQLLGRRPVRLNLSDVEARNFARQFFAAKIESETERLVARLSLLNESFQLRATRDLTPLDRQGISEERFKAASLLMIPFGTDVIRGDEETDGWGGGSADGDDDDKKLRQRQQKHDNSEHPKSRRRKAAEIALKTRFSLIPSTDSTTSSSSSSSSSSSYSSFTAQTMMSANPNWLHFSANKFITKTSLLVAIKSGGGEKENRHHFANVDKSSSSSFNAVSSSREKNRLTNSNSGGKEEDEEVRKEKNTVRITSENYQDEAFALPSLSQIPTLTPIEILAIFHRLSDRGNKLILFAGDSMLRELFLHLIHRIRYGDRNHAGHYWRVRCGKGHRNMMGRGGEMKMKETSGRNHGRDNRDNKKQGKSSVVDYCGLLEDRMQRSNGKAGDKTRKGVGNKHPFYSNDYNLYDDTPPFFDIFHHNDVIYSVFPDGDFIHQYQQAMGKGRNRKHDFMFRRKLEEMRDDPWFIARHSLPRVDTDEVDMEEVEERTIRKMMLAERAAVEKRKRENFIKAMTEQREVSSSSSNMSDPTIAFPPTSTNPLYPDCPAQIPLAYCFHSERHLRPLFQVVFMWDPMTSSRVETLVESPNFKHGLSLRTRGFDIAAQVNAKPYWETDLRRPKRVFSYLYDNANRFQYSPYPNQTHQIFLNAPIPKRQMNPEENYKNYIYTRKNAALWFISKEIHQARDEFHDRVASVITNNSVVAAAAVDVRLVYNFSRMAEDYLRWQLEIGDFIPKVPITTPSPNERGADRKLPFVPFMPSSAKSLSVIDWNKLQQLHQFATSDLKHFACCLSPATAPHDLHPKYISKALSYFTRVWNGAWSGERHFDDVQQMEIVGVGVGVGDDKKVSLSLQQQQEEEGRQPLCPHDLYVTLEDFKENEGSQQARIERSRGGGGEGDEGGEIVMTKDSVLDEDRHHHYHTAPTVAIGGKVLSRRYLTQHLLSHQRNDRIYAEKSMWALNTTKLARTLAGEKTWCPKMRRFINAMAPEASASRRGRRIKTRTSSSSSDGKDEDSISPATESSMGEQQLFRDFMAARSISQPGVQSALIRSENEPSFSYFMKFNVKRQPGALTVRRIDDELQCRDSADWATLQLILFYLGGLETTY